MSDTDNRELGVDVENAAEFFRAALEFDWQWGADDVRRFARVVGWEPAEFGTETTIVMSTSAQLNKPLARFELDDDRIHQVTLHLTDFAAASDPADEQVLAEAYAAASATVCDILGAPLARIEQQPSKTLWEHPRFFGEVVHLARNVIGSVIRPDYVPLVDELRARGLR